MLSLKFSSAVPIIKITCNNSSTGNRLVLTTFLTYHYISVSKEKNNNVYKLCLVFSKYWLFFLHTITLPRSNYNDALTIVSMILTSALENLQKKKNNGFDKTELFCGRKTEKLNSIREYVSEVLHWRSVLCRVSQMMVVLSGHCGSFWFFWNSFPHFLKSFLIVLSL